MWVVYTGVNGLPFKRPTLAILRNPTPAKHACLCALSKIIQLLTPFHAASSCSYSLSQLNQVAGPTIGSVLVGGLAIHHTSHPCCMDGHRRGLRHEQVKHVTRSSVEWEIRTVMAWVSVLPAICQLSVESSAPLKQLDQVLLLVMPDATV